MTRAADAAPTRYRALKVILAVLGAICAIPVVIGLLVLGAGGERR